MALVFQLAERGQAAPQVSARGPRLAGPSCALAGPSCALAGRVAHWRAELRIVSRPYMPPRGYRLNDPLYFAGHPRNEFNPDSYSTSGSARIWQQPAGPVRRELVVDNCPARKVIKPILLPSSE